MKRFVQILAIFAVLFCSFSISYAEKWQPLYPDYPEFEKAFFYDTDSIHYELTSDGKIDDTKITFWTKMIFTQAEADDFAAEMEDSSLHNLNHVLRLCTFSDNTLSTRDVIFRDHNNNIILQFDAQKTEPISSDPQGKRLYEKISTYILSHPQEPIENAYKKEILS
nr:MAG TPA: hypothetical protein [Caudoviricetes sp.]